MDAKEFFEIYEKLQPMKEPIQYKNNGVLAKKVDNDRYIVKINDEIFYIPATIVETGKDWERILPEKEININITVSVTSPTTLSLGTVKAFKVKGEVNLDNFYSAIENLLNGEEKEGEIVLDFLRYLEEKSLIDIKLTPEGALTQFQIFKNLNQGNNP